MKVLRTALTMMFALFATATASAEEGDFCGGIAGIQCSAGFECQLDGDYPDAGGECVPQFCGGIAAIQCPQGFECKLDGSYPDAGGECVEKQGRGLFESCGLYGPVCATGLKCWIPRNAKGINPQGFCWFK